jgi:hypothetical protein
METSARTSATISSTRGSVVPAASARTPARWMTGPSPSGSENGTPISITSTPLRSACSTSRRVIASDGSPAIT